MSDHAYQRQPVTLATGGQHTVTLPPRVMRGRLTGFLFDTNKAFLLPAALTGIRGLAGFYAAHPGLKVLVTGHTDTVGVDGANLALSDERAAAVAAFLLDDVDHWLRHYSGTPGSSRWGTREDQHMLSTLPASGPPFYGGPIHGQLDAATQDAVRRFQTDHGLVVDGVPGPITRRALITDYLATDGTSLPAGTEIQRHGCGEHHPAVPTPDETDEPGNRRVEVFFFDGPIAPPPQGTCPRPGCPEYPEWLRQTVLTIDYNLAEPLHAATVHVVDARARPIADAAVALDGIIATRRRTDASGLAAFADLPSGTYRVAVEHPAYQPNAGELEVGPPPHDDVVLAAAPGDPRPGPNTTTVALSSPQLRISYRQMFTNGGVQRAMLDRGPVGAGYDVTISSVVESTSAQGLLIHTVTALDTQQTDAQGVATFDTAVVGTGRRRASASAASLKQEYVGETGPSLRPDPTDDVLYRPIEVDFVMASGPEISAKAGEAPTLFTLANRGGVWRTSKLELLVDWKPVWIRAKYHAPRPGAPHPNDVPNIVVLHRTAGATMASAADLITGRGADDKGNQIERKASVHYVVDVDGYVLKLVRDDEVANHAGASYWAKQVGVNATSIGIEIVSADRMTYPPAQMEAVRDLLWRIHRTSNIALRNVVGHSDVDVTNTDPTKPIDLSPGTQRPHDPGIEFDWPLLQEKRPSKVPPEDAVALAADPASVSAQEADAMYGGYFSAFSAPWAEGDNDKQRQWGGRRRSDKELPNATSPIVELQRDFEMIGYSIAAAVPDANGQPASGVFDGPLARVCQRFRHRWFAGPSHLAVRAQHTDKLTFDRDTAIMVKAVLKAIASS